MARCGLGRQVHVLTSTTVTFTPHGSVCWSMTICSSLLISSREARIWSARPDRDGAQRGLGDLRGGVEEVRLDDAFDASTTRSRSALIFTETLSRVMTSCGARPCITVRRLTRHASERNEQDEPLAFDADQAAETEMTARSYSRST